MPVSILRRFFSHFVGDFVKTVKDDKMSYAAIPAALFWFVFSYGKWRLDSWNIIGPLILGFSFVICQHGWSACRAVINDVDKEKTESGETRLSIVDIKGEQFSVVHKQEFPSLYKLRAYGIFAIISGVCIATCILSTLRFRNFLATESNTAQVPPFSVNIIIEEGSLEIGTYSDLCLVNGTLVNVFSVALYTDITNNLPTRVRLKDVRVEIKDSRGGWQPLMWVFSDTIDIYFADNHVTSGAPFVGTPVSVDLVDSRISSDISAGETISGWIFLAREHGVNYRESLPLVYRFHITDIQGDEYLSDELTGAAWTNNATVHANIVQKGKAVNLSKHHTIQYYGESQRLN